MAQVRSCAAEVALKVAHPLARGHSMARNHDTSYAIRSAESPDTRPDQPAHNAQRENPTHTLLRRPTSACTCPLSWHAALSQECHANCRPTVFSRASKGHTFVYTTQRGGLGVAAPTTQPSKPCTRHSHLNGGLYEGTLRNAGVGKTSFRPMRILIMMVMMVASRKLNDDDDADGDGGERRAAVVVGRCCVCCCC